MAFLFLFVFSNHKDAILLLAASPTVTTSAASSITKTTATLNGSVSDNGGEFVTETGFEYGLTNTYGSSVVSSALYSFDFLFTGTSGSAESQFNGAYWMDIDSSGNIYVSDSVNNRIQKFDSSGNFLMMFGWGVDDGSSVFQTCVSGCQAGVSGDGSGQFNTPIGIALDSSDNIYVADTQNNRIQKFDSSANFVRTFGFGVSTGASIFEVCTAVCQAGLNGNGSGQMDDPLGLAVDASDDIYVTDYLNHRVQKFDSDGGILPDGFGSSGTAEAQFNRPLGIAIDQSSGDIFVGEHFNHRIQKFNSSGVFQRMFGWGVDDGSSAFQTCVSGCQAGTSNNGNGGLNQPFGLGVDLGGNVYVVDAGNDRVQKFTSSGTYVSKFGTSGVGNGQFGLPVHVVVDGAGDLYVSDFTNNKIQKFTILNIEPTQITGLTCGTTYHFRAYAENADGTSYGDDTTFTTSACEVPEVDTVSATSVTQTTATLNGLYVDMPVVPGLTRGFQYGPTSSYGQSVSENGNEFVSKFGTVGAGNGNLSSPRAVFLDSSGNIYVADAGNDRVSKFDNSGSWLMNITGNGGAFSSITDVFVDSSGNIFVADSGNGRVQKFNSSGVFQLEIGLGVLGFTLDVATDSSGNIYVADMDNTRLAKFNSAGVYLADFASGQAVLPYSIDIDPSDNVYVADQSSSSIQVFNQAETQIANIGTAELGVVFGVDYGADGNIYVAEQDSSTISKYNSSGTLLYEFGYAGTADGAMSSIYGGVFADSSGNVYVADTNNHRIQKFSLDFSLPASSFGCGNTYHFRAFATNADGTGYGDDMTFNTDNCSTTGGGPIYGCTQQGYYNYNPNATVDDGSCYLISDPPQTCLDSDATNYQQVGECIYTPGTDLGCTDPNAGNYDSDATVDDGSCLYGVFGCMDTTATNYNSSAVYSDGSCEYDGGPITTLGCMDSGALNFNPSANIDDGSCDFPDPLVYGCTDVSASNFNPSANEDNGSCSYINPDNPGIGQTISHISQFIGNLPEVVTIPIVAVGVVAPSLLLNLLQPGLIAGALIRLWNLIPILMGYRRKKRPWGTVYDSVTKQPLDPVYVKLLDQNGQERGTSITDLDGRYGFLAEAGTYTLSANKDNYIFPSTKLSGKSEDELYHNLYFGGPVELAEKEGVIYKNIPMDAINFNWNEFAKAENKKLMKFYSKRDLFFARIANTLFIAGFVSSVILFLTNMSTLNSIILGLYVLILVLRFFGIKPKQSGYAFDVDGTPLSFGILRLFSVELGREVAHTVVGKTGRYYMLTPNGEYYLKVSKKTGEDSYEEVLTTGAFRVKGGYVNEKISL